jgi:YHS domain-containing protein
MRGRDFDKNNRQNARTRAGALPLLALCGVLFSGAAFAAGPQFGGYCAEGLTMKKMVETDCSVNWTSADGKLYCFSSANSKAMFLVDPAANIKKAEANYRP